MKQKKFRVVETPVITDHWKHYFFNGKTGIRAILAEDLPRPKPPIQSLIDDMLLQQNPDAVSSDD
jgi:hypothetical protein